ncbi:MAG: hypothetical protein KGH79_00295 [Patescibacteria group bacterium]|nr:hypothetical protein [Patescibacteria group bacterium]
MIYALVGASGAGKTTLLHNLIQKLPEAQPLLSFTTRGKRPNDVDGEYEYVSEGNFDTMQAADEFLWTAGARGKRYATRKSDVEQALAEGLYFPILVPDVLKTLHEFAFCRGKQKSLHFIYLRLEDEDEQARRLTERGDSPESIQKSLSESKLWNEQAQTLGIRLTVIDAAQSPKKICEAALAIIEHEESAAATS